jgi:Family of unknown function (DUF5691)
VSFAALLDAAVAGTQRQPPPDLLAHAEAAEPELKLLHAAAYFGLRRLAGRPLERREARHETPACPPETLTEVPHAAAVRLSELIAEHPELLPEWLELVATRQLRVPHAMLPELLEYARSRRELEPSIRAVGGERMAWLGGLNAEWSFAARFDAEDRFGNGSREERILAFRHIRTADPVRARDLLAESWELERGDTLAALVASLVDGLSVADQPLLERGLHAARQEVRGAALQLLRRLPDSHFAARWTSRAQAMLDFADGVLRVQPPLEPDGLEDGLEVRAPKGMGDRAWWLQQALAFTPPAEWPLETLEPMLQTEWARPLIAGLGQAAASYADQRWCEDLLVVWSRSLEAGEQLPLNGQALYSGLDVQRAESVYPRLLEIGLTAVSQLAEVRGDSWSVEFGRFMITAVPCALVKWQYRAVALLRDMPLRLDPSLAPELERVLDEFDGPTWALTALERVLDTLEVRATMRQELQR